MLIQRVKSQNKMTTVIVTQNTEVMNIEWKSTEVKSTRAMATKAEGKTEIFIMNIRSTKIT